VKIFKPMGFPAVAVSYDPQILHFPEAENFIPYSNLKTQIGCFPATSHQPKKGDDVYDKQPFFIFTSTKNHCAYVNKTFRARIH